MPLIRLTPFGVWLYTNLERIFSMFSETKAKRSPMQIVGIVVIFVLAILIILTFVLFGMFKDSDSAPKMFGYRVYVVNNDRMEPRIPNGAAVFIEEGALPSPTSQSVILCRSNGQLWVIGYVGTEVTESGGTMYLVKYDKASNDQTFGIKESDIIGVARTQDKFLGWVIRFASSKAGMMTIVIIPCLIVIIYEVLMLLFSKGGQDQNAVKPEKQKKISVPTDAEEDDVDIDAVLSEQEDIPAPADAASEERYVEKQLRKATDKLSTAISETSGETAKEEITLEALNIRPEPIRSEPLNIRPVKIDPVSVEPDPLLSFSTDKTVKPESEPHVEPISQPAEKPLNLDELSPSRIDELIRLLEEEKKRLENK